jgi:uncharacterized membrane protein YhaH (DUF805 family)
MGGLSEIFGFEGRVNRLGYLTRAILAAAGVAGLGMAGAAALATLGPGGLDSLETWTQRLRLAVILLGLWAGFALTVRRLRDMGIEPAHLAPPYAALWVGNAELLQPMARLQPQTYGAVEAAWIVLQVLAGALVLCWPSRTPSETALHGVYAIPHAATYVDWRGGA